MSTTTCIIGHHLVLDARWCARISPVLRTALNRTVAPSPDLVQLVSEVELVGRLPQLNGSAEVECGCEGGELAHALDTRKAADLLGITRRGVRDLAQRGTLPACWHERSWRFSLGAVLEYADDRRW